MNRALLSLLTLAVSLSSAQDHDLLLTIRNPKLDLTSSSYSFELVNNYSKPVAGWTLSIEHHNTNGGGLRQFYDPSYCATSFSPLAPAATMPCRLEVNRWNTSPETPEVARVTSVLFTDGTAEGDLEVLDNKIEDYWSTYRETSYWLKRTQELRSADPVLSLRTLAQELRGDPPAIPDHDRYSRAAIAVRQGLTSSIEAALQQLDQEPSPPPQPMYDSLVSALELRAAAASRQANALPRPKQRLSPANAFRSSSRELRNPAHLTVLRFEENSHILRIVIKNDTGRPMTSWGFKALAPGTVFAPTATRGLGNKPIESGWVDVLELEPAPSSAYNIVALNASF